MQAISELKEQAIVDTPLLVFDCVLPDGRTEHWSTHKVTVGATTYDARVLYHSTFDMQTASDQGIDGSPRISLGLANADSHFSEIERAGGWKGARLTVGFLFYDLRNGVALTDPSVVFQGICNPPDQISETTFRLTAMNRMNLQRLLLPQVRIQRRCPWEFPYTADQRVEAVDGGANGRYSRYYRCGYSADAPGGSGSMNGTEPFTSCAYTRDDCQARGMLSRFGGLEFVPSAISVRGYGKDWTTSAISINTARYNDFVPMVYGTAWQSPTVVFARNDGNLTRMEVLLGIGEITGVFTVLVNDVEIPQGVNGANMTATGWYNVQSLGTRDGCFDNNFLGSGGQPAGDPYGSMAYLSVVVPNRISSGTSLPSVKVMLEGLKVPVYSADGNYLSNQFSANPAWILLDVLRRSGWALAEIDLASFGRAAAYCDEPINIVDPNGNTVSMPRFQCNLVLQNRRSAGDLVRGIRNTARLYLTYGAGGALQLNVENTVALEQAAKPEYSNSTEVLNGGWPSYEFGDGSNGLSGILRKATGEPSVTLTSRSIADTPNRMTVEFQDALNGYQQDSYEMVDPVDIALAGQEVSTTLAALGLPHYDQAARILKFNLDKSVRGNTYIEFQSSVKAFGIRPGDLITFTYLKEGFERQPFRVSKISPSTNYRTATITAQIHDDAWYLDTNGQVTSPTGATPSGNAGVGVPRPLIGSVLDKNDQIQFGVVESATMSSDGSVEADVTVSFVSPAVAVGAGPGIPLVNLAASLDSGGGLSGGQTLYYGVSGVNGAGAESGLSFLVRAVMGNGGSVTLTGLSFPSGTVSFQVYRGTTPAQLYRIATNQSIASQFTDTGLPPQLAAPPDPNFDHANFYWRSELMPETAVITHSPNSIGNTTLKMMTSYIGTIVRITRGMGAGQERRVASNNKTSLTISPSWVVEPDSSSYFVIAEPGWRAGATAQASPVQFAIPNRTKEVVHLTGRSANAADVECAPELSIVTRWVINGSGGDATAPPPPFFGMSPGAAGGTAELSGVSFDDLTDTSTISSGTLTLYYWDELQGAAATSLGSDLGKGDTVLTLTFTGPVQVGSVLQVGREVVSVISISPDGLTCTVERAVGGSYEQPANSGTLVYALAAKTFIIPFAKDFFGSPYSGGWSYSIALPDVRIVSAELFVTNIRGNSQKRSISLTENDDGGLRTLSGGQYSIQVDGYLAIESCVAPPIVVEAAHSVRDVYAVLGTAADAVVGLQVNVNGSAYCALQFEAGKVVSSTVSGTTLGPLPAGAQVTLAVTSVGLTNPGANLTVLIRL